MNPSSPRRARRRLRTAGLEPLRSSGSPSRTGSGHLRHSPVRGRTRGRGPPVAARPPRRLSGRLCQSVNPCRPPGWRPTRPADPHHRHHPSMGGPGRHGAAGRARRLAGAARAGRPGATDPAAGRSGSGHRRTGGFDRRLRSRRPASARLRGGPGVLTRQVWPKRRDGTGHGPQAELAVRRTPLVRCPSRRSPASTPRPTTSRCRDPKVIE